jgi:hypothetical protein
MHANDLANFINNEDDGADLPLKKSELLAKEAAPKLPAHLQGPHNMPAIHGEIGKIHTVEIHPDIDHLYNVKNFAQSDPRGRVKVGDIKRNKALSHMADKVPRDANGWVTPDAIDKHIEGLPKKKINLKVIPYNMKSQQHRELQDGQHQYVVSAELHPETLMNMKPEERKAWDGIKDTQHKFMSPVESDEGDDYNSLGGDNEEFDPKESSGKHQMGWARIDPYKGNIEETPGEGSGSKWSFEPNHGHWHVDEIQSDFQNKDKMDHKELMDTLSHGHEDPQHAIHSAVNALGRKMGVKSMSMDTPESQAKQSGLREFEDNGPDDGSYIPRAIALLTEDAKHHIDEHLNNEKIEDAIKNHPNPYLKSALKKLSPDKIREIGFDGVTGSEPTDTVHNHIHGAYQTQQMKDMSGPERDALQEYFNDIMDSGPSWQSDRYQDIVHGDTDDAARLDAPRTKAKLPVHQIDTYEKRPKKLGAEIKPKKEILGEDPDDDEGEVQYMKLHKRLKIMLDLMKSLSNKKI